MVYKDSRFYEGTESLKECQKTWSYAPYLKKYPKIEYAQLYVLGKTLEELCSVKDRKSFSHVQENIQAIFKANQKVGLKIDEHCIYDIVPSFLLQELAEIKNEVCIKVFENYEKPVNYEHLFKINQMVASIKEHQLNLDLSKLIRITIQDKNTYKLISQNTPYINYDMSKTITGRLSTKKGSFPIMTLAKKYRNVLIPTNDWLFEMDFNACELRVALALLGHAQPEEDLHAWNLKNVFTRAKSRDNAKKRIFAWLYNPNNKDESINKIYDREKLKTLYFKENKVVTPFGREIKCDEYHAVNYLVQSTAADLVFEQMYKIWQYLDKRKSFIKFCNHDSVMIDLHSEQEYEFNDIKQLFSNTRFGKFKVNCLGGKNWLEIKDLYIK